MKISGTSTLTADRAAVYRALNDPAVLVATIPGCQRLEALGGDAYKMTVAAGVGSIKGVYDGEVRLTDHVEPSRFTLKAQGAGAPGTIGADVLVTLEEDGGRTVLSYEADAVVGGMIGGVGQRMLTGVSKRMADEFFRNVDAVLSGVAPVAAGAAGFPAEPGAPKPSGPASPGLPPGPSTVAPGTAVHPAAAAAAGTVFTAPAAAAPSGSPPGFVVGVLVGAGAALVGAVVGGWIASRRRG
jgi:carbon monoxide dehydrogenase subunit G